MRKFEVTIEQNFVLHVSDKLLKKTACNEKWMQEYSMKVHSPGSPCAYEEVAEMVGERLAEGAMLSEIYGFTTFPNDYARVFDSGEQCVYANEIKE